MLKRADDRMPEPEDEQPIGEVVSDLVEQGKAYAKAEVELAKAQAIAKVGELKGASKSMYESMSEKELEKMAHTKRKGKKEHAGD